MATEQLSRFRIVVSWHGGDDGRFHCAVWRNKASRKTLDAAQHTRIDGAITAPCVYLVPRRGSEHMKPREMLLSTEPGFARVVLR